MWQTLIAAVLAAILIKSLDWLPKLLPVARGGVSRLSGVIGQWWSGFLCGGVAVAIVAVLIGGVKLPSIDWPDWIDNVVVVDPPAPIPGNGLMILVAEETNDRNSYTPGQRDILLSTAPGSLRAYAAEKCTKIGGAPAIRVLDKDDFADLSREQPWVQEAAKQVDLTKLPFVVVSNGKTGGKFQAKPEALDTLAAIKKFEGK